MSWGPWEPWCPRYLATSLSTAVGASVSTGSRDGDVEDGVLSSQMGSEVEPAPARRWSRSSWAETLSADPVPDTSADASVEVHDPTADPELTPELELRTEPWAFPGFSTEAPWAERRRRRGDLGERSRGDRVARKSGSGAGPLPAPAAAGASAGAGAGA